MLTICSCREFIYELMDKLVENLSLAGIYSPVRQHPAVEFIPWK